jgi:hypothetical protein
MMSVHLRLAITPSSVTSMPCHAMPCHAKTIILQRRQLHGNMMI